MDLEADMWSSLIEYHRPKTIRQALRFLQRQTLHTVPISGGVWLMSERPSAIEAVVDLSVLNLAFIKKSARRLQLGATVTLQTLTTDPIIQTVANGLLCEAALRCEPRAIRNRATLGGTLMAGASTNQVLMALLALRAQVIHLAPTQQMTNLDVFLANRNKHLSFAGLITGVVIPTQPANIRAAWAEVSRTPRDQPIVNATVVVSRQNQMCRMVRLILGGIAPDPIRMTEVESMLSWCIWDDDRLGSAAQKILATITPSSDERASADYRREMASLVAVRALRDAWEQAGKERVNGYSFDH